MAFCDNMSKNMNNQLCTCISNAFVILFAYCCKANKLFAVCSKTFNKSPENIHQITINQ